MTDFVTRDGGMNIPLLGRRSDCTPEPLKSVTSARCSADIPRRRRSESRHVSPANRVFFTPSTGGVTTATSGPVIRAWRFLVRYLTAALVAALTLALTPVAAGHSLSAPEKKQQLRRYYKANGVVRWIGAHARTTEYHPDPRVKRRWKNAARFWVRVREDAWRELHPAPPVRSVPQIICAVFGPNCSKALSVAACESHFYVGATNHQYFGVFQMGSAERARFGGSSLDPWDQVRAAYRYFSVAGWSPWECA